jgi:hypothetical protein
VKIVVSVIVKTACSFVTFVMLGAICNVPIFLGIKCLWGYGTVPIASGSSLSKEHEWRWPGLAHCEHLLVHGFEVPTAAVMKNTIF